MADFLLLQTPLGVSAPESALNTLKTLQADFTAAVTQQLQVSIPNLEKITDGGLVGSGHGYATRHDNDYFGHPVITMSDRLNTSLFALYVKSILGGIVTDTEVTAAESYDHVIQVLAHDQDPQLISRTFALKVGGLDLLLGGMVGNSLSLNFADAGAPQFSAEFIGTGIFDYMAAQTPALVLPAFTAQNYMGTSAAIVCSFNDGTLLDLSNVGRFKSITIQHNNNTVTNDRRPGDGLRTSGDPDSGAYVKRLTRDVPSLSLQFQVYVDGNKREWLDVLNNTQITDFKFKAVGRKIGASTDRHECEFTVPQGVFLDPQITPDGRKHVMSFTLSPELKSGEKGYWKARIRNGAATIA